MDRYTSSSTYLLTHRPAEHYTPAWPGTPGHALQPGQVLAPGSDSAANSAWKRRPSRTTDLPTGAGAMTSIANAVRRVPLAAAVVLLAGCAGVTPIGELLDNSTKYDGKTVRVQGEVQESAGGLGVGA